MLDINKELEKFNRLLEQLDAAPTEAAATNEKPVQANPERTQQPAAEPDVSATAPREVPSTRTEAMKRPADSSTLSRHSQETRTNTGIGDKARLSDSDRTNPLASEVTGSHAGSRAAARLQAHVQDQAAGVTGSDRLFEKEADSLATSDESVGESTAPKSEPQKGDASAASELREATVRSSPVAAAKESTPTAPARASKSVQAEGAESARSGVGVPRTKTGLPQKSVPSVPSAAKPTRRSADRPATRGVKDTSDAPRQSQATMPGAAPGPSSVPSSSAVPSQASNEPEDIDRLIKDARRSLSQMDAIRRSDKVLSRNAMKKSRPLQRVSLDRLPNRSRSARPRLRSLSLVRENVGATAGGLAVAATLVCGMFIVPGLLREDDSSEAASALTAEYGTETSGHHYSSLDPAFGDENAALSISTYPNGARVFLNEELVGVTPFQGIPVQKGQYSIAIEKPDFTRIDTSFALDADHQYFFALEADAVPSAANPGRATTSGQVASPSRPASSGLVASAGGASASVDAIVPKREKSVTAAVSRRQAPRSAPGGARRAVDPDELARAAVVITSSPSGAAVFMNDLFIGTTPLAMGDLDPGAVALTFQKDGFQPLTSEIELLPTIQVPYHAPLVAKAGTVKFNIAPSGDIYIDGVLVESGIAGLFETDVAVGHHTVRVSSPDYGHWNGEIEVTSAGSGPVEVDLVESSYLDAIATGDQRAEKGEFSDALVSYRRALTMYPNDETARQKITQTERAINERGATGSQQSSSVLIDGVYSFAENPPVLIGGLSGLHKRVQYPEAAYQAGVEGRVFVEVVVDEEGRVLDPKVTRGLPMGCNEAAVRAIKDARFKPATINGVAVKVRHTLFINFKID